MPKEVEDKLKHEAAQKGFKRGSDRYNAYVYGTMQRLGLLKHNHAGNLGPDKLFKGKTMHERVTPVEIGIVVALILLWYTVCFKNAYVTPSTPIPNLSNTFLPVEPYTPIDYSAWEDVQYNSLGANAGAGNGQSN